MRIAVVALSVALAGVLFGCAAEREARAKSPEAKACAIEAETERGYCQRYNRLNQELCLDQGRPPGERVRLSPPGEPSEPSLSRYADTITCSRSALDCQVAYDEAYLSCRVRRPRPSPEGLFLESQ